jgi:ElaB/YqjD/DUF883 family membrane-anchored ribosome-binding protein
MSVSTIEEAITLMTANIDRSIAEMSRKMAESRQETDREIREFRANTEQRMNETSKHIAKMSDRIDETSEHIAKMSDELDKWVGFFGNNIGHLVELILIPGIKRKINEFGHNFNSLSARKQYYRKNGKTLAEIDLFLENGDDVMIVEVKTQLSWIFTELIYPNTEGVNKADKTPQT